MTILPLDPAANASAQALESFLSECRDAAAQIGRGRLVSITIEVDSLDPLAVLESIFEPGERHFYAERPSEGWAIAGAESALAFTAEGPQRFVECQRFIDTVLEDAIVVGPQEAPFAGPHFFASFCFLDSQESQGAFESACVFVPRWQVAQRDGRTSAVANVVIEPETSVGALAARLWRAHAKFGSFDYTTADFPKEPVGRPAKVSEVGGRRSYEAAVSRAVERIDKGEIEKIVLARAKDVRASTALHPLYILNGLRQRFADCTAFSVANGRGQSLIGATPERLLRVSQGVLLTEALAGSAQRGATASEDAMLGGKLLRSEKDLREHEVVLRTILSGLEPVGLELKYSHRPILRKLSNVQHLHTPVEARLTRGVRLLELLSRLHPTPAVGGTPREVAVPLIAQLESFPRGLYGGTIGWIDARGDGEFSVALRSALVEGNRARLFAGAGIVAGSSPEMEFAETELKFKAMEEALLGA